MSEMSGLDGREAALKVKILFEERIKKLLWMRRAEELSKLSR